MHPLLEAYLVVKLVHCKDAHMYFMFSIKFLNKPELIAMPDKQEVSSLTLEAMPFLSTSKNPKGIYSLIEGFQ